MTTTAPRPLPDGLLDAEDLARCLLPLGPACTLPTAAYTDPRLLAWERRNLFAGSWTCVGRDADLFSKEAIPFLDLFRPGILAVREDVGRAGRVLAQAAIRAIREPEAPPLQDLEVPEDPEEPPGPPATV